MEKDFELLENLETIKLISPEGEEVEFELIAVIVCLPTMPSASTPIIFCIFFITVLVPLFHAQSTIMFATD